MDLPWLTTQHMAIFRGTVLINHYSQTDPGGPMPQRTTLRELQVQALPQAFAAACKKWSSCDESHCSAIHVDVMQIQMTSITNAAADMSCYGPAGRCYSRAIIRSLEGISVPGTIRAFWRCRFLKNSSDAGIGFWGRAAQLFIRKSSTLDFVLGFKSFTGARKSRCPETARDPASLPRRVPASTHESDPDGERPPPPDFRGWKDGCSLGISRLASGPSSSFCKVVTMPPEVCVSFLLHVCEVGHEAPQ